MIKQRTRKKPLVTFAFVFAILFALYLNFVLNDVSETRTMVNMSESESDLTLRENLTKQPESQKLPPITSNSLKESAQTSESTHTLEPASGSDAKVSMNKLITAAPPPIPKKVGPVQLLSIDFHISPIADLKDVFGKSFKETVVHDFSLSGACGQKGTCSNGRINIKEDLSTLYLSQPAKESFYDAYRSADSLVRKMDAMICSHPSGMCELIMPFNRSVILWVTTRFEQGREGNPDKMRGLISNFRALAKRPDTSILANNMYDVHYFNYFTGLNPVYIPSFCDYTGAKYSWDGVQNIILMHGFRPRRNIVPASEFVADIRRLAPQYKFEFVRDVYPGHYGYDQIAGHPAMLHIPYQASIMSFFEHYRMCIPLIAPSVNLLVKWHMHYKMVSERTWDMALHNKETSASVLPRHAEASPLHVFDPNDEFNEDGVRYWLQFSDFYVFPHVILFDSWEDLAQKLAKADLRSISKAMCAFNKEQLAQIEADWREVLGKVPPASTRPTVSPDLSYADAMNSIYGQNEWIAYR
jgi:hypothetical protein